MTTRQEMLLAFIESKNGAPTSSKEVITNLGQLYSPLKMGAQWNNQSARRELSRDVQEINASNDNGVIIIHGKNGYSISTSDAYTAKKIAADLMKAVKIINRAKSNFEKINNKDQVVVDSDCLKVMNAI